MGLYIVGKRFTAFPAATSDEYQNMKKARLLPVVSALLISGCISTSGQNLPEAEHFASFTQADFSDYIAESELWIRENRRFIGDDPEQEVQLNLPFERKPEHPGDKAVLLVHGLSDSPYSFTDIADELVAAGYTVRSILLPGHGTKAEDLMHPELEDWTGIVSHHTQLLSQQYDEVWLGGYSTGANLVTAEAMQNRNVDGLLLFAPAFQPQSKMVALAPYVRHFVDWADKDPEENRVKYDSLAMNGAGVYYQTTQLVNNLLDERPLNLPVFMMVSEADSVIDTGIIADYFQQKFIHNNKQLIWYGEQGPQTSEPLPSDQLQVLSMDLPEHRISNGSHMSILYKADNPLYGINGLQRQCNNGQDEAGEAECRAGKEVWFSAWGYQEKGKTYARLTWNPYFKDSMQRMINMMP